MNGLRRWYHGLATRERGMLWLTIAVLIMMMIWLLWWQPMLNRTERLAELRASKIEQLTLMREQAQAVQDLRASGAKQGSQLGQESLLAVVDRSARQYGLGPALRRAEPGAEGEVRLLLSGANFNTLMNWLESLHYRRGIQVSEFSVNRVDGPGLVDARLTLRSS